MKWWQSLKLAVPVNVGLVVAYIVVLESLDVTRWLAMAVVAAVASALWWQLGKVRGVHLLLHALERLFYSDVGDRDGL